MSAAEHNQPLPVDISLLDGLEAAMSKEEQIKITELMTSGDPEQLALAATVKFGMAQLLKEGVTPSGRSTGQTQEIEKTLQTSYTNDVAVVKALLKKDGEKVHDIRLQEKEVKERKRLHPLPVRMPLYAWIDPFDAEGANKGGLLGLVGVPKVDVGPIPIGKGPLGRRKNPSLIFVDDEWDGTLTDAFAAISIASNGTVKHTPPGDDSSAGIAHIVKAAGDKKELAPPGGHPRVIIQEAHNDASKKGFRKGDVITHVNGKAFAGTSEDLVKILQEVKESGLEKVQIVVNAELSVAEALRLRSLC